MIPTILSGMQPSSSSLHLGNYLGALKGWVELQDRARALFMVADLHALTTSPGPEELRKNVRLTAAQYLAAGIDPKKSLLFVQSTVPEHNQLAWILACLCGFGEAMRMTQFKDKSQRFGVEKTSVGLFTYPLLMAADILVYQPQFVPVGEDQKQHLELTRNLAERFNARSPKTLGVPEPFSLGAPRIYDLQNPTSKMSKSADSKLGLINLLDHPTSIRKKILRAVTDSDATFRYDPVQKPGLANLISIYASLSEKTPEEIVEAYASSNYGSFKKDLADLVVSRLEPIAAKTRDFLADPAQLEQILAEAGGQARALASRTLERVYSSLGLS